MANGFQFLAQSMAPDIIGSFNRGRAQVRQVDRERLADQELRENIERGNRLRQLAPRVLTAATPGDRQQVLGEIAAVDPQTAMGFERQFASREQQVRTQLGKAASALTRIPRDKQAARAQVYQMMLPDLRAMGLDAPDQYGPEVEGIAESLAAVMGGQSGEEAFTLSPGQRRFVGGQEVASVPAAAGADDGFTLSPGQTRYGPEGRPIANSALQPDPDRGFDIESKLRNEYNQQSKEFRGVADSYQRIVDSASDPSAAGDLSLIFNYMKVLDPGSTVREGEFATAQNAGSIPARIIATYNKVMSGERLAPEQRADFVGRATKLYRGQEKRFGDSVRKRYEELAKGYGVDPRNVTVDLNAVVPDTAQPGVQQPGGVRAIGGKQYVQVDGEWYEQE